MHGRTDGQNERDCKNTVILYSTPHAMYDFIPIKVHVTNFVSYNVFRCNELFSYQRMQQEAQHRESLEIRSA